MNTRLANRLWATLLVEELVRCGARMFCVAPGSRSTPLAAAIAENPKAEALIHYDERGTAFAALGYARATGLPAAWVTTSGTAVANGFPAVVEASVDSAPMLLLTADRPPELRQTGANQTIDQPGIFGGYVRWSFDLPAPNLDVDPASVLTTVDQAMRRARRTPAGPVHLNLMFREPFLPDEGGPMDLPEHLHRWRKSGDPYTKHSVTKPSAGDDEIEEIRGELRDIERVLIVAGRLDSREKGEAAIHLSRAIGWPLLPDIGSQVRLGNGSEWTIPNYDALLADESFAEENSPEAVLHVGGGVVSKRLQQFIVRHRPEQYVVVKETPFRLDPNHLATRGVETDVVDFCHSLPVVTREVAGETPWASKWREASERVGQRIEAAASKAIPVAEPFVARAVSRLILEGHGLVVASSMPVRDLDACAVSDGAFVPVAANRGASGIDGTVATAAGFARGHGAPVTLLIGDLALLHDLNSLAMLRSLPVTVVVINNDGGGIFSFLPVSRQEKFFEEYFGTPQGLGFEHAAAMFGLDYRSPKTMREFEAAYREAVSRDSPSIIEVRTDRNENVALHRELLAGLSSPDEPV
ncbi:MAG: 2-succinyl-5-enolpyruvyl-6-hydroxy-3-cyclohexene-1-carboxylic-acid synthase [Rubrobacteraceae bacterium]